MDDCAVVRELVADLVAEGVEATVPATVRETVEAVYSLIPGGKEPVSHSDLRKALKLGRGIISRRVRAACDRGYLKDLEDRKGRPTRVVVGDPMPEEIDVLPAPEALSDALLHRCGVDAGDTGPPAAQPVAWELAASDGR